MTTRLDMVNQVREPRPLDPQRHEQEPDERELALQKGRLTLVSADEVLLGMQMGNFIYAAALGLLHRTDR